MPVVVLRPQAVPWIRESCWPWVQVYCLRFYLIATRHAAQDSDPIKTLAFQCVAGTVLLTPQAALSWSTPAGNDLLLFAGLGLFSAISHALSIVAFRLADASTLAPLVYVGARRRRSIGYVAFGEVPGLPTVVGAGLIVAAGLILLPPPEKAD